MADRNLRIITSSLRIITIADSCSNLFGVAISKDGWTPKPVNERLLLLCFLGRSQSRTTTITTTTNTTTTAKVTL
jgi:hypothetical protein